MNLKVYSAHIIFSIVWYFTFIVIGNSQEKTLNYELDLMGIISSNTNVPFWMVANMNGIFPNTSNAVLNAAIYSAKINNNHKIAFTYKGAITTYLANNQQHILINELYGSLHYKNVQLNVGVKQQDILWSGLSSSNGNIAFSGNARAFPGYNFKLIQYIKLPFAKKWLSMKGNYGDFLLNDKRIVSNARLHIKSLFLKYKLSDRLEFVTGLNHYAQWAGISATYGKQPSGIKDYLKVIMGSSGGSNALKTDQINVIGNQLGSYLLQFNYAGKNNNWNFFWSHPFEDRSGRELMNYPDGLYGFYMDFKKPTATISHVLIEMTYTKHQSGGAPHYTDENGSYAASGMDNYFNNGIYQSGWTYFGNTIGSPYFTTKPEDENGITQGIILGDNRLLAFNIGFKGNIKNVAYKAILSHTTYFGWFENEYSEPPIQFSGLFEINLPQVTSLPFAIKIGAAFDTGTYSPSKIGGFLKISKRGIF
ncbi:capsule assembly Wzi family protein [Lutibacter sp.]